LLIKDLEASGTPIKVRGRGTSFELLLDDGSPFPVLEKHLRRFLDEKRGSFSGLAVSIHLGRRLLNLPEVEELRRVMEEHQISVGEFRSSVGPVEAAVSEPTSTPVVLDHKARKHRSAKPVDANETLLVRHTCRTGTSIKHHGNVVILGNVNPGAEVIAGGDVVVMGTLRGTAHAGAYGNPGAAIVALSFQASQVRIATLIAIDSSKETHRKATAGPEAAYISDGVIMIEPYTGALPRGARTAKTKKSSEANEWQEGL
jgi:septum site-determining protein MinC